MPPESDLNHEILIQYLIETIRCTECDSPYDAHDVHVVAQDEHAWTLVVVCSACGAESMIMAYLEDGESSVERALPDPAATDLIWPEVAPPDRSEIAAWSRFLQSFEGDLRDLLHY